GGTDKIEPSGLSRLGKEVDELLDQ
ncbi:unnamed protein product, partial [Onchocerca ochengi]|uniref:M protein n=1 Tax=Onchocerca ochengi TaxID=42157 RepID=A0A182EER5_ONCOC